MKKNVLIINKTQFGYHTDYYKYCEYLRDEFRVTYLGFDSGLKKLEIDGVKVIYIPWKGIKLLRGVRFIFTSLIQSLSFKGVIFIHYFDRCQFIKRLLPWKKMILDIRTLSTSSNENERKRVLGKIKKVAGSFNHTTVISYGIRAKLALCDLSSTILPLGSDIISETNKNFKKFNMLYVGNLSENREIEKTIVGLAHFRELNPNVEITYDIVGGEKNQIDKLKKIAEEKNIKKSIKFHGKVLHSELKPFFDKCNIGVSFVPIKEWYDYQPPTKTYEYINSGLFTIATSTFSNREVIDGTNGLLINDTSESFSEGLSKILVQKNTFDSEKIRKTLIDQSWKNIVNKYLKPLIGTI